MMTNLFPLTGSGSMQTVILATTTSETAKLQNRITILNTLSTVFLALAILFAVVAVLLFFYFRIPEVYSFLSGKARDKKVREMQEKSEHTGKLRDEHYTRTTSDELNRKKAQKNRAVTPPGGSGKEAPQQAQSTGTSGSVRPPFTGNRKDYTGSGETYTGIEPTQKVDPEAVRRRQETPRRRTEDLSHADGPGSVTPQGALPEGAEQTTLLDSGTEQTTLLDSGTEQTTLLGAGSEQTTLPLSGAEQTVLLDSGPAQPPGDGIEVTTQPAPAASAADEGPAAQQQAVAETPEDAQDAQGDEFLVQDGSAQVGGVPVYDQYGQPLDADAEPGQTVLLTPQLAEAMASQAKSAPPAHRFDIVKEEIEVHTDERID